MKHLACIMDGNRRWAKKQRFSFGAGHEQGAKTINVVSQFCLDNNIPYLSLYAFSLENLKRSDEEKAFIFNVLQRQGEKVLPDCLKHGIRIKFIGCRELFPSSTQAIIGKLEEQTACGTRLQLNLLFCYGSQQEILYSVKEIVKQVKEGRMAEQELTEEAFSQYLWTAGIPAPDLIIRTGGAVRLSNFLLYQAAYSEFYFLDCLWPDISYQHLDQAIQYFNQCKRNFGT